MNAPPIPAVQTLDQSYISTAGFGELYAKADEVSRLVGGFMAYLQHSQVGGHKFKGRS